MHAMKQALKNHMMKAKSAHDSPKEELVESPGKEKEELELGDKAPPLHGGDAILHGDHESLGPQHMDLLKMLVDQLSHPGRDAMTLDERAGQSMREKLASMPKHGKI